LKNRETRLRSRDNTTLRITEASSGKTQVMLLNSHFNVPGKSLRIGTFGASQIKTPIREMRRPKIKSISPILLIFIVDSKILIGFQDL